MIWSMMNAVSAIHVLAIGRIGRIGKRVLDVNLANNVSEDENWGEYVMGIVSLWVIYVIDKM